SCGDRGLFCGLRFKLTLPPFEVCNSFCQRLILFAELFRLRLNLRKLTGMRRRCDGENRRCGYDSPLHERPPKQKARRKLSAPPPRSRSLRMKPLTTRPRFEFGNSLASDTFFRTRPCGVRTRPIKHLQPALVAATR